MGLQGWNVFAPRVKSAYPCFHLQTETGWSYCFVACMVAITLCDF